MRKIVLAMCLYLGMVSVAVAQIVNLTPWPKSITTGVGEFVFPASFSIVAENINAAQQKEVKLFAREFAQATGCRVSVGGKAAPAIRVSAPSVPTGNEAYRMKVTEKGVVIEASTATGLFYAFQSLKKMMPANVMLGRYVGGLKYALPFVDIDDEPRYAYRGFMLDVSRHFFDVDEIKKLLRLMSYYKMNYFHWHLTDDQGWRLEIKKYPRLTKEGATRSNSRNTSLKYGYYYTNRPYGPYYYTQKQVREVVDYAARLHITVIPEIDMPGHLCAAMTAYPEFSCTPDGKHNVWVLGGISSDVLNVADPRAVEFAKDVLTEVARLFPAEQIHIGGDECPTAAWEKNEQCKARVKEIGLKSFRELQSVFIKQMTEHLSTLGKKICVWNEAITAEGADTEMLKQTGATVFCWCPTEKGARMAETLGLPCIITPWETNASYYINRRANTLDVGAGYGKADNLQIMYNYVPVPVSTAVGVQGTFWCEHVSDVDHLEHLALPRLMGIAESGWTPLERKSFDSFLSRMKRDTALFRLGGYRYHPQFIDYDGAEPK